MVRILFEFLSTNQLMVLVSSNLILTVYGYWKLATNHLKHQDEKIDRNLNLTKIIVEDIGSLKERVAKIEGKLSK